MLKLIKYLRPYGWLILVIFALLFGQAISDLSLPGLMSDIVNVGVQQGGIEHAAPEAVRASEFDKITLFMTDSERSEVQAAYRRLERSSLPATEYATFAKKYPALANEPVFVLNTIEKTQRVGLDTVFSRYVPVVAAIERGGLSSAGSGLPEVPAGTDPFTVLAQLPPDQMSAVRSAVVARTDGIPSAQLKQYSTIYIAAEYKALGMNVGNIQTWYMLRIGSAHASPDACQRGRVGCRGLPVVTDCGGTGPGPAAKAFRQGGEFLQYGV